MLLSLFRRGFLILSCMHILSNGFQLNMTSVIQLQGEYVTKIISSRLIPPLISTAYKGQMGRIAIVGGSPDYTGAPYYAGQSALKFGADLSFIFCAKQACNPIKSYSPELMVTSFYDEDSMSKAIEKLHPIDLYFGFKSMKLCKEEMAKEMSAKIIDYLPRIHSLVIGPGLGNVHMQTYLSILVYLLCI